MQPNTAQIIDFRSAARAANVARRRQAVELRNRMAL